MIGRLFEEGFVERNPNDRNEYAGLRAVRGHRGRIVSQNPESKHLYKLYMVPKQDVSLEVIKKHIEPAAKSATANQADRLDAARQTLAQVNPIFSVLLKPSRSCWRLAILAR